MADWTPVEAAAKSKDGKFQVLVNGAWIPAESVAKNKEGKFMAYGVSAPTPTAVPAGGMKQEESTADYVANRFRQGMASIPALGPLATDIVNMPIRPFTRALGISNLGGGQNTGFVQFPATEQYNRAMASAGAYDPNKPVPRDRYGRPKFSAELAGNVAEMAGMNVLPGVGTVMRAERPILAATKELAGTVLSGEGATMGAHVGKLFPGDKEANEAAGQALGSMTGPMLVQAAIDSAAKGGNWVRTTAEKAGIAGISDAEKKRQAARIAAEKLSPQLSTEAAKEATQKAEEVARKVPGFGEQLTLGRVTGSPAIKSMEHHFASTDPEMLSLATERERKLRQAIEDYSTKRFPASDWSAQSEVKYVHENKLRSLDEGLKRLDRQERVLAAKLPRGDIYDIGSQQRKLVTDRMEMARAKKNTLYDDVAKTADKLGVKVNMGDVERLASDIAKRDVRRFQDDPGVVGKILRQYSTEPGVREAIVKETPSGGKIYSRPTMQPGKPKSATFSEFQSLYREANREAQALGVAASTGDLQAAQKLPAVNEVRSLLGSKLQEMSSPEYGEVGKKLQTANTYYRDQYANLFKRGVGAEVLKEGRFGPATENAKITESLIFKRGDPSGVQEFLHVAGDDPRGRQLLENGVFDMLSKKVVRDGKVSKTALDTFLRDYKEPLAEVPDLRKKIENVAAATESLQRNTVRATQARSELARSTLAKIAGEENQTKLIANAVKSPKYLDTLLQNTGAESRKDLARGVMEMALNSSDAHEFIKTNEAALKKILGAKQISNLRTIAQARDVAESVKPPGYVQYQQAGDILEKYGTSVPQMVSEQKAVTSRFAGKEYAIARVGVRWWNKLRNDEVDKLMKSAVFDPEMAKSIAAYVQTGSRKAASELDDHLLAHGMRMVAATLVGQGQIGPKPYGEQKNQGEQ